MQGQCSKLAPASGNKEFDAYWVSSQHSVWAPKIETSKERRLHSATQERTRSVLTVRCFNLRLDLEGMRSIVTNSGDSRCVAMVEEWTM